MRQNNRGHLDHTANRYQGPTSAGEDLDRPSSEQQQQHLKPHDLLQIVQNGNFAKDMDSEMRF